MNDYREMAIVASFVENDAEIVVYGRSEFNNI